jgi:hypothetical protein
VPRVIHRTWSPSPQTEAFRLLRARIYGDTIALPISDQLQRELCRVRERPGRDPRPSSCRDPWTATVTLRVPWRSRPGSTIARAFPGRRERGRAFAAVREGMLSFGSSTAKARHCATRVLAEASDGLGPPNPYLPCVTRHQFIAWRGARRARPPNRLGPPFKPETPLLRRRVGRSGCEPSACVHRLGFEERCELLILCAMTPKVRSATEGLARARPGTTRCCGEPGVARTWD